MPGKSSFLKRVLESLGENNKPIYVVIAIATAKGIFRPLFTMMDKKESPETKKYAALREGMTEVIAIPTYWACGTLAAKGADLCKDQAAKTRAQHNLMFLGVCTAALLVIPGLCSLVVKPFTEKIFAKEKAKQAEQIQKLDITSQSEIAEKPNTGSKNVIHKQRPYKQIYHNESYGMRV